MTPWLSQDEIDDLCIPLRQHAAQIRFMEGLGLQVKEKPNGAPLVMRSHFEAVMQPKAKSRPDKTVPNSDGLRLAFSK